MNLTSSKALAPTDAAYLAGFVDGEGCLGVRINKRGEIAPRFEVVNTDEAVLLWAKEVTGVGEVYPGKLRPNKPRKYVWSVAIQPAVTVLKQLLPYLRVKAMQAHLYCCIAAFRRLPVSTKREKISIGYALVRMCAEAKVGGRKAAFLS